MALFFHKLQAKNIIKCWGTRYAKICITRNSAPSVRLYRGCGRIAAKELAQHGIKASLINACFAKPLDQKKRCTWLNIIAHAKQSVCVSINTWPTRFTKESRSASSQKIFRRLIPRTMMWWSAPAASILAFRGIPNTNTRQIESCQSIYQYPSPMPPLTKTWPNMQSLWFHLKVPVLPPQKKTILNPKKDCFLKLAVSISIY